MDDFIILRTNSVNFLLRILLLTVIVFLITMFMHQILYKIDNAKGILIFEVILFLFIFIAIISSFFGISKVELDKSLHALKLKTFFSEKFYKIESITGFYTTYYRGKLKEWRGLILKMDNGKKIRLRQQNLKSISDLNEYLKNKGIQYLGEKIVRFS